MTAAEWSAVRLTAELAAVTTALLLLVGTPIAWWLARTRSAFKAVVAAVVAMPLVLPPSVLGFYLLVLMGPQGPVGQLTTALGLGRLPFTFSGLVVASVLYSMPFVVQPLQQAFEAIDERTLEAAASLRAGPWDRFLSVTLPVIRNIMLITTLFSIIWTFSDFQLIYVLTKGGPANMTHVFGTYSYQSMAVGDIASKGFGFDLEEHEAGIQCIAVPVSLPAVPPRRRRAPSRRTDRAGGTRSQ